MDTPNDKLEAIALYLAEHIFQSHVEIQPLQEASPVYILTITKPKIKHRLGVCRPLIEDNNYSVEQVRSFAIRDKLEQKVTAFEREEYFWNPVGGNG
jgi:hypothetical protein